jgi:hypothetical protein
VVEEGWDYVLLVAGVSSTLPQKAAELSSADWQQHGASCGQYSQIPLQRESKMLCDNQR